MKREYLFRLFEEARRLTGHRDYVVIGSLSILGTQDEDELPDGMAVSIDIDSYTRADPGRILDVKDALGEGSDFHRAHGYYLDPVSPSLPSLPDGWQARMTSIDHGNVRIWFLDPDDAAISKYARSQPNDLRWIRAGIRAGYISLPRVQSRVASTTFLDAGEEATVRTQLAADVAWFDKVRRSRDRDESEPDNA